MRCSGQVRCWVGRGVAWCVMTVLFCGSGSEV